MRGTEAEMAGTAADGLLGLTTALSAAGEPGEILDAMTDWCPLLLRADLVNISLLDADRRTLRLVSSVNTPAPVAEEFAAYAVDAPLPSRDALRTGEPVVLRSVAERDEAYPELAGVVVEQESFCVVPLCIRGEGLGVLGLGWVDAADMDDEVLALARTVGGLCAGALQRALSASDEAEARQRAESLLGRLGALQRVAAELSYVTDVQAAAHIVLASALETLGAEAATFNLLDDEGREGTLVASLGIDDSPIAAQRTWRVSGSMLVQELLRTGLPVLLRDHEEQHARFPDLDHSNVRQRAWANLLLRSGPRVLGLVSFGWADAREFDIAEVALMQALADHLAAAVERARLTQANTELLVERTRVAETLQRSLLPAPLPDWPGVVMAAGYEPADVGTEVCGDFYDVFEASDGSLIVVIGDVAGRGIEAAGLTGMARHTLRALASDMSPQEALLRLNTAVVDRSRGGDQRLLTAGIVRLFQEERGLCAEVALAGHCMPVLLACRSARHVGTPGMMLGATDAPVIGTAQVDLEPGDVLVLHTDGVLEARRNGLEFGEDRLLRLLSALSDPEPEAVVEQVLGSVRWFRTTAPDDMAVVAFKVMR
jgi:serine phosphatase RsbU (regulator of sigma subunit)